jgi:hypothetical protein
MSTDWIPEHDALNKAFMTGEILTAGRRELERHLLTTAEVKISGEPNQERNKRRADTIRHLLQVRITEQVARRSFLISLAALIVSVIAVMFAGMKLWQESQPATSAASPPAVSPTPSLPVTALKGISP